MISFSCLVKLKIFKGRENQNAFDKPFHQTDLDDKSTDLTFDGNDFSNKPLNKIIMIVRYESYHMTNFHVTS